MDTGLHPSAPLVVGWLHLSVSPHWLYGMRQLSAFGLSSGKRLKGVVEQNPGEPAAAFWQFPAASAGSHGTGAQLWLSSTASPDFTPSPRPSCHWGLSLMSPPSASTIWKTAEIPAFPNSLQDVRVSTRVLLNTYTISSSPPDKSACHTQKTRCV